MDDEAVEAPFRKRKWQLARMPTAAACATVEGIGGRSRLPDQHRGEWKV
jgi:hypothetical protein